MICLYEIFLNISLFLLKKSTKIADRDYVYVVKRCEMVEIKATDSIDSLFQVNIARSAVNPFAAAEDASAKTEKTTESKSKTNTVKSASELLAAYDLTDPANKVKVLSKLSGSAQLELIDLLAPEAKVLGMKLYEKNKILNMLFETSQKNIAKVLVGSMPTEKIFQKIPEEFLNRFLTSDKLEKKNFLKAFQKYTPEQLVKFMTKLTGYSFEKYSKPEMLKMLEKLPVKILQPSLLNIDPKEKIILISKMVEADDELFKIFSKGQLMMPLDQISKEEMLKGFENLDTSLVGQMLIQLPEEAMPLVLSMIDGQLLSTILLTKYPSAITAAFSEEAANSAQ